MNCHPITGEASVCFFAKSRKKNKENHKLEKRESTHFS